MNTTDNYNLKKPDYTDYADVSDFNDNMDILDGALKEVEDDAMEIKALKLTIASVSSLPKTVSNSKITADMEVIHSVLSNPSAQTGDWTVNTSSGSLTISGTISGTTNITLYLQKTR